MPSGSSRTVERIEAGKADGDARMRQLIMELTRAQSAAALPAPAMPALTKAGGTHDRQAFLRAAQRAITRSAKPAGQYMPAPPIAAIAAVPGVDVLQIAQFDLSTALGIPGQFTHPLFLEVART